VGGLWRTAALFSIRSYSPFVPLVKPFWLNIIHSVATAGRSLVPAREETRKGRDMDSPLTPLLRQRYAYLAKDLLGPMLDTLNIGRATCGGDLDKLLIMLVVALRTAEDKRALDIDPEAVLSGAIDVFPSLSTNVRSIADSTGIPKENVRRKVAALVEAGWIHRDDNSLSLAPHASRMLTGFREQMFQLAVRYHQTVAALEPELEQEK
jgi:hypothetical protein